MDGMLADFDDRPAIPLWLIAAAAVAMMVHLYLVFMWVPTEATMGIVQRLFYFHVPAAMAAFVACFVGGIAAILYLVKRDPRYDDLSLAANESLVAFEAINIGLGMMWAKPIWGIWWTWDAKLTSAFLLLFLYVAYLAIRAAAPVEHRATICAVVCILGMADVPMVYMANRWYRTQHPAPVLSIRNGGGMGPGMEAPIYWNWLALVCLGVVIAMVRMQQGEMSREIDALRRQAHSY